jgi:UDP-GlcNAc:undecaprenyl-phosphate GlcNAc-1-phosphate transferase
MGAVKTAAAFSMLIPILVLAVPIFDMGFAFIRRGLSGKSLFKADRLHLHHRIMDSGLGHKKTTYVIYAISLTLGVISIISVSVSPSLIPIMFVSTVTVFILFLWKLGLIKIKKS